MSYKHYIQSGHNKDAWGFLSTKTPKYLDWEITVLLYSALHRINHYFERHGFTVPASHFKRNKMVEQELPHVYESYRRLHVLSMQSRYDASRILNADRKEALRMYADVAESLP